MKEEETAAKILKKEFNRQARLRNWTALIGYLLIIAPVLLLFIGIYWTLGITLLMIFGFIKQLWDLRD